MTLRFIIRSAPRTKKTSNRIVRVGRFRKILPSKAYEEWNKSAQMQLLDKRAWKIDGEGFLPLTGPLNCRALFYRQTDVGDSTGFYQALADTLQEARIVENDRLITQWDGSRLLKDARNPRVEVTLETL